MARPFLIRLLGGLLLWGALGCGGSGQEKYIPSDDTARGALEAALNAWQSGAPPGKVPNASPPIEVVDSKWKGGKKLKSFQILKEEASEGPKCFSVRLTLKDAPGDQVVRYFVIGKEPIWVYREEDYKGASSM